MHRLRWGRSGFRRLVDGLARAVLRVWIRLAVLGVVWPRAVRRGRVGCLLGRRLGLARSKQPDGQRVGLDDQARPVSSEQVGVGQRPVGLVVFGLLQFEVEADLGEVAVELLLALHLGLVFLGALRRLLRPVEEGVEGAEVGARHPYCA